ncbi:MAG: rhodanese-like domain-containing protein, partial [Bacteroidota bacterium]|nr:rhodanese-like domain-containing protein [Bacteroidota bacterium]
MSFQTISTHELQRQLEDPLTTLIDVRPVEAYNGWKINNEARGGHIKGARSLPLKWTNYIDWIEIVRSKGILPDQSLIIYGYDSEESKKVADRFYRSGYENIRVYDHFISEWCARDDLPMDHLQRYQQLVYPEWLNTLINGGTPPEFQGREYVICHGHYRNRGAYEEGHIPGAIEVDTNTLESPVTWNRRSPEELKLTLENLGITEDTTVILYGRFSFPDNNDPFPGSSAGHLGSIRAAFIMMYAGVKDVRVLNGGLLSWEDAGYEVTTQEYAPVVRGEFKSKIPGRPELAVDVPEAKQIIASDQAELVSVRSWPEYIGEVSGYNYIEKKGRIPGSVFGNCGTDAYHMENYRNLDHTTREYHEIEEIWREVGVVSEKHNA